MKVIEHNGNELQSKAASDFGTATGHFGLRLVLSGQDAGVQVARAFQSGTFLNGVLTEAVSGDFAANIDCAQVQLREVEIPSNRALRQQFLAAWSEAARKAAKKGLGFSMLLLPLSACIGGGGSDVTSVVSSTKGFVIDGYIANAFIFRDENGNGIFDSGEANSRTGIDGSFTLGGDDSKAIVVDGRDGLAVDLDNPGEAFTGILKAPAGSTVVTPLTTLVQQLVEADPTLSAAQAQTAVKTALGIDLNVDLTSTDPIASDNLDVYKAGVQVAGLIAAAGGGQAGLEVTKALSQALQTATVRFDLTNVDAVKAVMDVAKAANSTAMSAVDTDVAASIAASKAGSVAEAVTFKDVADVQSATFTVSVANDVITFDGSASGTIVMTLNASGGASFSRAGVNGKDNTSADASVVNVDDIESKSIAGSIDLTVVVTANATADQFIINAPDATKITLRGTMGDGADKIIIKIADITPNISDDRILTLDTSALSVTSQDSIVFDFAGPEGSVILNAASNIAQFSTIEVKEGTIRLTAAQADGKVITSTGTGKVEISGDVGADTDLTDIEVLTFENNTVAVTAGTLTLTATQADGMVIGGEGTVIVTGPFLSGQNFSGITTAKLTFTDGVGVSLLNSDLVVVDTTHTTIQAAIDAAGVGATILVGEGTYAENLVINVENLTLVAAHQFDAIINTQAGFNAGSGFGGITILADGVTLNGFTINQNVGQAVINTHDSNGVSILNNAINGIGGAEPRGIDVGFATGNSNGVIITGNSFNDLYAGVYFNQGDAVTINNNSFTNMGDGAIVVDGTWSVGTVGVTNNTTTDAGALIYVFNPAGTFTVSGNTLDEDTVLSNLVFNETKGAFYATIQGAIDAADAADTINVPAGTWNENLLINKALTLLGAQSGEAASGTARDGGESVINGGGTFAVTINADDVTIDGFEITGFGRDGINLRTTEVEKPGDPLIGAYRADVEIANNWIHATGTTGQRNGVMIGEFEGGPGTSGKVAEIENVSITGNHIEIASNTENNSRGIVMTNQFTAAPDGFLTLTELDVSGNTVVSAGNALFASAGTATFRIDGASIADNAFTGTVNSYNLFDSTVSGNTFNSIAILGLDGSTVSGNTFNANNAYGLGLWGNEFGANVSQNSTIENNTFNYNPTEIVATSTGGVALRAGVDFGTITFDGNTFNNGEFAAIPAEDVILRGTSGADALDIPAFLASSGLPETTTIRIEAGAGDDTIRLEVSNNVVVRGGDGTDTAAFETGTNPADVIALADNLTGVELIRIGDTPGSQTWVVLDGMSLQAAITAAAAEDTIIVGAGTYDENLTISKALTIVGPNEGVAGTDDTRSGEAVISGLVTISGSGAVVLDGLKFLNDTPIANRSGLNLITVESAAGHEITNSVFESAVVGGSTGGLHDVAIFTNVLSTGSLSITNNLFAGDQDADFGAFGTAAWGRGIFSNGGGAAIKIADNTFENTRTGVNLEGYANEVSSVSGNSFFASGSGISVGNPTSGDLTTITDNEFTGVGTEFNLGGVSAAVSFDVGGTGNVALDGIMNIISGSGNDTISGTDGPDLIKAGAGTDTFVFSTTQVLNGSDTVTDFSNGSNTIKFNFDEVGGLAQADLRGEGTGFVSVAENETVVSADAGLIVVAGATDVLSEANAKVIADTLSGLADEDQFYLAFDDGTNTAIFLVVDTSDDGVFNADVAELLVTLQGVTADTLDASKFGDFA